MAIFTPRGLKIRFSTDLAFTYLARLHPKVSAFKVLKTVEGIELIPFTLAFITGLLLFIFNLSPIYIAIYVSIAYITGGLITTFGFFVIPFLVQFSTVISYIHGYGIYTVVIIVVGLVIVGWKGVLFYFIGRYTGTLILSLINYLQMIMIFKKTQSPLTASERNFFNAYRYHASRIGITTSIELEKDELDSDDWKLPYYALEAKWPEVTARFTDN